MRSPQYRTKSANDRVLRFIVTRNLLTSPSILQRGLQSEVLNSLWPERTPEESELIWESILYMDELYDKYEKLSQIKAKENNEIN